MTNCNDCRTITYLCVCVCCIQARDQNKKTSLDSPFFFMPKMLTHTFLSSIQHFVCLFLQYVTVILFNGLQRPDHDDVYVSKDVCHKMFFCRHGDVIFTQFLNLNFLSLATFMQHEQDKDLGCKWTSGTSKFAWRGLGNGCNNCNNSSKLFTGWRGTTDRYTMNSFFVCSFVSNCLRHAYLSWLQPGLVRL